MLRWGSLGGGLLVAFLTGGCVTAEGRQTSATDAATGPPAAISQPSAQHVLGTFNQITRQADRDRDLAALARVETGAALAAHTARLRLTPAGRAVPHVEITPHLAIPRLIGYPKWFMAGALRPGSGPGWVAVFEQRDAGGPWRATSVTYHDHPLPRLATEGGNAVAVAADDHAVRVPPGKLADRHAARVVRGVRATAGLFADHRTTSGLARTLTEDRRFFSRHGWAGEEHAADADSTAFALRTEAGEAIVWYSLRVTDQFTNRAHRYRVALKPAPARLLGKRWVTRQVRLEWRYAVAALVPVQDREPPDPAPVRVLGGSVSLVRAAGN
jgi:hypothetical protein